MKNKMSYSEAGRLGGIKASKTIAKKVEERIKIYEQNPKLCKQCSNIISYRNRFTKFCNQSCAAIYNNEHRIREKKYCLFCNKELLRKINHQYKNRKFCNIQCQNNYKWKSKKIKIESNKKSTKYSLKKYLLLKYGNKCQICDTEKWLDKPILLIMDHIDGNHNHDILSNVRLICSNCDATLDTYKRKNGRSYKNGSVALNG